MNNFSSWQSAPSTSVSLIFRRTFFVVGSSVDVADLEGLLLLGVLSGLPDVEGRSIFTTSTLS